MAALCMPSVPNGGGLPVLDHSELQLVRWFGQGGQKKVVKFVVAESLIASQMQLAKLRKEFEQEITVLTELRHYKNIVKIIAIVRNAQCESDLAFVTEHYARGSLRQLLHDDVDHIDLPRQICWAKAIARTLQFLHAQPQPLVHFDVKPHNVMIADDDSVRVGDFGLSKTQTQTTGMAASTRGYFGTTAYMAPEQFQVSIAKLSFKVDCWSFGSLLVELFGRSHSAPYSGINAAAIPYQITEGKTPPELDEVEPMEIRELIRRHCFQVDPQKRSSMKTILQELHRLYPDIDEQQHEPDELTRDMLLERRASIMSPATYAANLFKKIPLAPEPVFVRAAAPQTQMAAAMQRPPVSKSASSIAAAAQQQYSFSNPVPIIIPEPFLPADTGVGCLIILQNDFNVEVPVERAYKVHAPIAYAPPPPLPSKAILARARVEAGISSHSKPAPMSTLSTKSSAAVVGGSSRK